MTQHWKILVGCTLGFTVAGMLHAATPITDPNVQPAGFIAGFALSSDVLVKDVTNPSGGGKAYRPSYDAAQSQGDVIEYNIDAAGALSTGATNWSARARLALISQADRKLITRKDSDGTQIAFRWSGVSSLSDAQKQLLDPAAFAATALSSDILTFLRGDRSKETPLGTLRKRANVFGDIVHATPVYVGAPSSSFALPGYAAFAQAQAKRAARLYVAANDGVLHALDAATGDDVYGYIPSTLINKLGRLSTQNYQHTYYIDGALAVGDVQLTGDAWHTVLAGSLGAGAKSVFVLDITDAGLSAEAANTGADKKILWELDGTADADLGYVHGKPVVTRLNDGKWYALLGNGDDSTNSMAMLYVLDLISGKVLKIPTDGSGTAAAPNGLSAPALVDIDGDLKSDYAYAGDINGNLWRFDLTGADPILWAASSKKPLFITGATQPITTAPDVAQHPNGGLFVYFGTGQALAPGDLQGKDVQTIYAVRDNLQSIGTANNLVVQTLKETVLASATARTVSNNPLNYGGTTPHTGWKIELPAGERVLVDPAVRAGRLQLVTTNPTAPDTTNWLMEFDYRTGASARKTLFDLNADKLYDVKDNIDANGNGKLDDTEDYPIGQMIAKGVVSQPSYAIIAFNAQGTVERYYINNMPAPAVGCTGFCAGGFVGGHMDVDTDSPQGPGKVDSDTALKTLHAANDGLGNDTDGHQHEYDKVHGVVFADFFALEPRRGLVTLAGDNVGNTAVRKLDRVTEVYKPDGSAAPIAGNKEFIVVLANADLSTGGKLKIGNKTWKVVDYQKMVTDKLLALGATKATAANFKDTDGDSLVFTLDKIKANNGALSIEFDSNTIIDGGLIPTLPQCVWSEENPYDKTTVKAPLNKHITIVPSVDTSANLGYRWRNGSLTMQLLDVSGYLLQDKTFLPQLTNGTVVGGIHARMYTAANNAQIKDPKQGGFTLLPDQNGLLYEAALFWHYGDLYAWNGGGAKLKIPCYGNDSTDSAGWQAAVKKERDGLTDAEYKTLISKVSDADYNTYVAANQALADYLKNTPANQRNETTVNTLTVNLKNARKNNGVTNYDDLRQYARSVSYDILKPIDRKSPPTPTAPDPNAGASNPVSSPQPGFDIRRGRQTWTDVPPS